MREGSCKMCGLCCKAICLSIDKEYIINRAQRFKNYSGGDISFAYRNFIQISKAEALRINPYLQKWIDEIRGDGERTNYYFYHCRKIDEKTNLCTEHNTRPKTCSRFPWYDRQPGGLLYSPECGYQTDIDNLQKENDKQEEK